MTEMEAKTKGIGFALRIATGVSTVLADRMNSYSQSGEDLLLWEYFGARPTGFFLEAGANHPTKLSQTWLFELHGWKGILVEPLAKNCELLRQHRPGSRVFQCALGAPEQRGRAQIKVAGGDDALSGLVVDDDIAHCELVQLSAGDGG